MDSLQYLLIWGSPIVAVWSLIETLFPTDTQSPGAGA